MSGHNLPRIVLIASTVGWLLGARRSLADYRKAIDADAATSRSTVVQ